MIKDIIIILAFITLIIGYETRITNIIKTIKAERKVILIPYSDFYPLLENMNKSTKGERMYWHVEIFEKNNEFTFRQSHLENFNATRFLI